MTSHIVNNNIDRLLYVAFFCFNSLAFSCFILILLFDDKYEIISFIETAFRCEFISHFYVSPYLTNNAIFLSIQISNKDEQILFKN